MLVGLTLGENEETESEDDWLFGDHWFFGESTHQVRKLDESTLPFNEFESLVVYSDKSVTGVAEIAGRDARGARILFKRQFLVGPNFDHECGFDLGPSSTPSM